MPQAVKKAMFLVPSSGFGAGELILHVHHRWMLMVVVVCNISTMLMAQSPSTAPSDRSVVDFHSHITFKHYHTTITHPSLLEGLTDAEVRERFGPVNWRSLGSGSRARRIGKGSHCKNYFQATYNELDTLPGSIICATLYPFEKQLVVKWFHRLVARCFVTKASGKRLRVIARKDNNPFREFNAEYKFATLGGGKNPKDASSNIMRYALGGKDLREHVDDPGTVHIVLSIEGAHALMGPIAGSNECVRHWRCGPDCEAELVANAKALRQLNPPIFFIGLSHFSWNKIAGNAKSFDKKGLLRELISGASAFSGARRSFFNKFGEGIHGELDLGRFEKVPYRGIKVSLPYSKDSIHSHIGFRVLEELFRPAETGMSKPILIDVKHMDVQARTEYYSIREALVEKYGKPIPVIASHVAVSGEDASIAHATGLNPLYDDYDEIRDPLAFYKEQQSFDVDWTVRHIYTQRTPLNPFANHINANTAGWFYPWSINLYDEEIAIIHESDGIMGLMLDGRQLGNGMKNYDANYEAFLKEELKWAKRAKVVGELSFADYWEMEPFIRNLFYMVGHCGPHTPCWEHVAIGSDFDGLIDPLDVCATAEDLPAFKVKLIQGLKAYTYIHENECDLGSLSVEEAVQKLFYDNGRRFILKYY